MKCDGDTEWTDKLQPAVLAANTQTKKSTSYTPFYLMFGRNFDSSNLLNLITSPTDPGMNSHMLTEFETSDEELQVSNDPYEVPKNEDEWIESITSTRKIDKITAIQNIKKLHYFHFLFANFDAYVFHALGMKCDFILNNKFLLRK